MPSYSVNDVRPAIRSGRPASFAFRRSMLRSSIGSTRYFVASEMNRSCSSLSFAGSLAARSLARLKSPRVSYSCQLSCASGADGLRRPGQLVDGGGEPAVGVDGAVAEHLEVLRRVALRRLRVVERVDHAHALDRRLHGAVDALRLGQTGSLEHRRGDVDDVGELRAHPALVLDPLRPAHDHAIAGAAEVGRHLLRPRERRVAGDRPAGRHVRIGASGRPSCRCARARPATVSGTPLK